MTKMTYANAIEMVLGFEETKANAELVEKLEALKTSLARKNAGGERKATATQIANEKIKEDILEIMGAEPNRIFTVTEIMKALGNEEFSIQKISALARQLVTDGKIERFTEKRKTYFRIVK